jgi:CRISPR-associated protein (TIGR03986 family)
MTKMVFFSWPCWAVRDGDTLTGEVSYRRDGKKAARRTWRPDQFDAPLARWFAAASDQDRVEVIADLDSDGQIIAVRMARPPVLIPPRPDPRRLAAVAEHGGKPNPYTFIPTPPRTGLPPGLGNGPPPPHGVIDPATQWSGWLVLRLETTTPMLLPGQRTEDEHRHSTYAVRIDHDGKPLLHGASVKGALRSAYESVTNSRYAVFRGHDRPLAYRRPAGAEKHPIEPARVEADGTGGLRFQLCEAYRVRIYGPSPRKAEAVGRARQIITRPGGNGWDDLHGRKVACTATDRKAVLKVALAEDERALGDPDRQRVRGWLSVTGHSIEGKTSERLFSPKIKDTIKVKAEHHVMWQAVLASYHEIAEQRDTEAGAADTAVQPSRHIASGKVPDRLADGDLVYLERDGGVITAIQPVYIGRMPYQATPAELLDKTLRPAPDISKLSPADRLFGWAPPQVGAGRAAASGYRGRLRITSIRCETENWQTTFEPPGVTLAPLSTPKPTQARFYASPDQDGSPMRSQAQKSEGYQEGGGLRGRKAYWYPSGVGGDYWKPGTEQADGHFREWQQPPDAAPSQTSSHLGWVKEGTEFTVRLFVDAVPGPELGPLIWLASQSGCPLRLGGGKPLGFGAVTVSIDWDATELRTGDALRGCWTSLRRPDAADSALVSALADDFDRQAKENQALAPSIAAFSAVAAGLPEPAAYPRTRPQPEAETYHWFVANDQIKNHEPIHGYALPHVLEQNQSLPHISPANQ